jgi:hypothetical protein
MSESLGSPFAATIAAHLLWTIIEVAHHVSTSCVLLVAKSCVLDADQEKEEEEEEEEKEIRRWQSSSSKMAKRKLN